MTTQTPLITGTDFVVVATKDIKVAEEFYSGVLGLPLSKRWGKMPAAEFETGSLTLAVMQSDAFGMQFQASKSPIALQVDDVPSAREVLESRGVQFRGEVIDSGVCHQTFFEDPDGNLLGIHHRYAPAE